MAFTQTDLDNVQTTIMDLAMGQRIVRLHIGDKVVEYGEAQLETLKTLRNEIQVELNHQPPEVLVNKNL